MSVSNETERRIQFRGHVDNGEGKHFPLVSTIQYKLHDPTTLTIEVLLLGDEEERTAALSYLTPRPFYDSLWLHSDEERLASVQVLGIHHVQSGEFRVSFGASEVQIGLTDKPSEQDTTWFVKAELTPSGILQAVGIRHFSFTGDISFEPLESSKIEVSTDLGTLEASERYAHHEGEEFANKVRYSVQRASITGLLKIPSGKSLASVNEALRDELKHVCTILSFCYRQPVSFYEIEYFTDPNTTPENERRTAALRRRRPSQEKRMDQDELIHYNNLVNGGLEELIQKYKRSPHKEEITRAISFLAASYKMATLESSYFLAYSALDLITSASNVEGVYLVNTAKWGKIQKLLRSYIDSIAETECITNIVGQLKEKLPELRRVSSVKRVIEACKKLGVKTDDLWRKDGFEPGLRSATKIRDSLFHAAAGQIDDLWVNLIRIRVLVERLLLEP
jgi:hypothetical protein